MSKKAGAFLKTFTAHGVEVHGDSGDGINWIADCPFSGKERKLYINTQTGQWDSKVAGVTGNIYTFFRNLYELSTQNTTDADYLELSVHRKLPESAFRGIVCRNPLNGRYLIPEFNPEGKMSGLGSWFPGSAGVFRTANTKVQLNYAHEIAEGTHVFICEGEWDFLALRWLFKTVGKAKTHKAICVPGAGTFKPEWVELFKGKIVRACYDNDDAGRAGAVKAWKALRGVVEDIQFAQWSSEKKDGYDVRDLIVEHCAGKDGMHTARKAYLALHDLFKPTLDGTEITEDALKDLKDNAPKRTPEQKKEDEQDEKDMPKEPTATEMERVVMKWLKMDSSIPLDVMYGTVFANRLDGDPVWMFLIAPPGGSKTELLMTLNRSEFIETTTTLTAPALVSGIKFPEGEDPSLLVKVDGRMLVIKDFTTILTMQAHNRDEVFGILRDVYDGYVEKFFGTGVKKSYHSKFGILAGVTPVIDALSAQQSSLGERFLKFRLSRFEKPNSEEEKIKKALGNVDQESKMRREMQLYAKALLRRKMPEKIPAPTEEQIFEVTSLAMFTASMRGSVTKDPYTGEMLCLPVRESGTRLAKQLVKLGIGICVYRGFTEFNNYIMDILRIVAMDTCPDRIMAVVAYMWKETKDDEKSFVKLKDIEKNTSMSSATITRVMDNLRLLEVVKDYTMEGDLSKKYRLTPRIEKLIKHGKLAL